MTEGELSVQLERLRRSYGDSVILRALVQAVPVLGGSIDTLIAGGGLARMVEDRLAAFLEMLRLEAKRIMRTDGEPDPLFLESQDFAQLFMLAAHSSVKTRDRERVRLYARLLLRASGPPWGELRCDRSEELLNSLAALSTSDVRIL
jgi:hypothetical protein